VADQTELVAFHVLLPTQEGRTQQYQAQEGEGEFRKIPSCLPFLQGLALALLVPGLPSAQTTGASIQIDSLPDTLTITESNVIDFTSATGTVSGPNGGLLEFLTFSGNYTSTTSLAAPVTAGVNFLAPAGGFEPPGSVSDTLSITFTPTTAPTAIFVQGQFLSDLTALLPLLPGVPNITEDGTFQDVSSLLAGQGAPSDFMASARSDTHGPDSPSPAPGCS
jgi:hypothetical protein